VGRLLLPFRTHRCNYAEMAVDRYCEHLTGHGVDVRVGWYFRRIVVQSFRALHAKGLIVVLLDGWRIFGGQSIPLFRLGVVMRMQMWNRTMG
jgi:hypothetical protein